MEGITREANADRRDFQGIATPPTASAPGTCAIDKPPRHANLPADSIPAERPPPVFAALHRRRERRAAALAAYTSIVERAREPTFYLGWGVPDTLDGRFEVLALHIFLVLNRLKGEANEAAVFAQELFDTMFGDLDSTLREMGAGDLGVGRRVQAMAKGLYGRIAAYERGLGDEAEMAAALRRNLFGTAAASPAQLAAFSDYVRRQVAVLAAQPVTRLIVGAVAFAPLEASG